MLRKGDMAPDFTEKSTEGEFTLSEAGSTVVLFYFPKAGSKVCTKEAFGFRDRMAGFNDLDVAVVGVSPNDSLDRLREFSNENGLEFPLISDADGEIAEKYGLSGLLGISKKMRRVTFVIHDGVVVERTKGMFSADKHVEESLEAVKRAKKPD